MTDEKYSHSLLLVCDDRRHLLIFVLKAIIFRQYWLHARYFFDLRIHYLVHLLVIEAKF